MNRFKITEAQFTKALKFLKTDKGVPPAWAKKHKEDLKVKGNVISTVFEPLVGSVDANLNAEVHLEINFMNMDVKSAKIIGRINPLDPQEVIRVIKIWDVDGDIEVNPPIDPLK